MTWAVICEVGWASSEGGLVLDWGRREKITQVVSCKIKLVGNGERKRVLCFLLRWVDGGGGGGVGFLDGGSCGGGSGGGDGGEGGKEVEKGKKKGS